MPQARDYTRERLNESPQRKKARAARNRARAAYRAKLVAKYGEAVADRMMKDKDVDHKKPLSQGGSNDASNTRLRDPSANRADKGTIFKGKKTTRPKNPRKD